MGCTTSQDAVATKRPVTAVGQTERMVTRAKRAKAKESRLSDSVRSNTSRLSNGSRPFKKEAPDPPKPPPKLDESGHLMPEEVVRRSMSSVTSKRLELGTPEHPIFIEVSPSSVSRVA